MSLIYVVKILLVLYSPLSRWLNVFPLQGENWTVAFVENGPTNGSLQFRTLNYFPYLLFLFFFIIFASADS